MHVVAFIIRIYHNARSPERQIIIYVYICMYIRICTRTGTCCSHCVLGLATGLVARSCDALRGEKNADKNQESTVERLVSFRGNCPF